MIPFGSETLEYELQEITADRGPDLVFTGRLVAEFAMGKSKPRSTALELWETRAGNWVLITIAKTSIEGEVDRYETMILDQPNKRDRIIAAMDRMGWSNPARALAKRAGWVLKMEVD